MLSCVGFLGVDVCEGVRCEEARVQEHQLQFERGGW